MIVYYKACTKCGVIKALSEFPRYRRDKPAVRAQCKQCTNEATRRYKAEHREQIADMDARYYARIRASATTEEDEPVGQRTCNRCNTSKPIADFYRTGWPGRRQDCRSCFRGTQI